MQERSKEEEDKKHDDIQNKIGAMNTLEAFDKLMAENLDDPELGWH